MTVCFLNRQSLSLSMKFIKFFLLISLIFFAVGCSSSDTGEDYSAEEIGIADDTDSLHMIIVPDDVVHEDNSPQASIYTVQLGAFTTNERAEIFVGIAKTKTSESMRITYSSITGLYEVHTGQFGAKKDSEKLKNKLRGIPLFKDAFTKRVSK